MSRNSAARAAYLSQVEEAFGQHHNPIPALASMVLPQLAALVMNFEKDRELPLRAGNGNSVSSSLFGATPPSVAPAVTPAPVGLSSDLPTGAGVDWPPLKDVCTGCGEEFSTEFGIRHCS